MFVPNIRGTDLGSKPLKVRSMLRPEMILPWLTKLQFESGVFSNVCGLHGNLIGGSWRTWKTNGTKEPPTHLPKVWRGSSPAGSDPLDHQARPSPGYGCFSWPHAGWGRGTITNKINGEELPFFRSNSGGCFSYEEEKILRMNFLWDLFHGYDNCYKFWSSKVRVPHSWSIV